MGSTEIQLSPIILNKNKAKNLNKWYQNQPTSNKRLIFRDIDTNQRIWFIK